MAKAIYVGVDGVSRRVNRAYVGVDNISRKVLKGYIGVENVARQFFVPGQPLNELAVGSSVYMNVGGVATEFLIVHQGNPDTTLYDSSCDGTWLLMKDCLNVTKSWNTTVTYGNENYANSQPQTYLNNTFVPYLLDSEIQDLIKQVKIPYCADWAGTISTGENGLSVKAFLLAAREVGALKNTSTGVETRLDGAKLDYFPEAGTSEFETTRIAKCNGSAVIWWLRTLVNFSTNSEQGFTVLRNGQCSGGYIDSGPGYYIRPALILPNEALVDETFNIIP